jgi:hypothetical protein
VQRAYSVDQIAGGIDEPLVPRDPRRQNERIRNETSRDGALQRSRVAFLPDMPTASYNASFLPGGGFHPTLSLTLSTPSTSCPLYALVALPPSFIADRFQLAQLHSEGRLGAYDPSSSTLNVLGERDLEAPVSRAANSSLLVRLRHAEDKGKGKEREEKEREKKVLEVEVPLHLRYQVPVQERWVDGQRMDMLQVEMPWPIVFWACEEGQGESSSSSSYSQRSH